MSESDLSAPGGEPLHRSWKETFLQRKLPYVLLLSLTLLGVAYTSVSHQPIYGYWEFLALATGVVGVTTGWTDAYDRQARFRLLRTQAAHWAAILVAMNIVLLPGVQRMLTPMATSLALLLILALGTYLAGVQISLELCFLGIAMALSVPAIAWLKQSVVFLILAGLAVAGLAMIFWRRQEN
jgi:hypothetical protein